MSYWDRIKYFTPEEMGSEKMNFALMNKLDMFRELIKHPVIIHCGYETSGHTNSSFHYMKMAADFHVENHFDYGKQFRLLMDLRFNGIGWYPEWNNPGWHVDVRDKELFSIWKRINGKYIYFL
jgi:uncharacterized protein YcbK (DUF882 family)